MVCRRYLQLSMRNGSSCVSKGNLCKLMLRYSVTVNLQAPACIHPRTHY